MTLPPPGLRLVIKDGTSDKYWIDIVCIKTGKERYSYDISEVVDLRQKGGQKTARREDESG